MEEDGEEEVEEVYIGQKERTYPSIYGYFELLPQDMRDNEVIQDVARGLEKFSYNVEDPILRQEVLNEVCNAENEFDEGKHFSIKKKKNLILLS